MTTHATVEVRRIAVSEDQERAYEIRRRVFLDEQRVPPELEFDADDAHALHALAIVAGEPVATGRLVVRGDHAQIGRMAVLAEHRGHGVGRAILEELVRAASERGASRVILHAQVQAIGFYESLGFKAFGEVYDEAGIPHRNMERELP